jgi:hypothetical protein
MVKRDHLFWHHISHENGIKHAWELYKKGRRSALGQLGRCACTTECGGTRPPRQGIPAQPMLVAPAPAFERVEDVVIEKTLDTIATFIIMITDYIVGPKTPQ